jgi:AraC-like DNA-binding protein/ligand-binding sensor domain-containing protein/CheY-like chemotaxis protein
MKAFILFLILFLGCLHIGFSQSVPYIKVAQPEVQKNDHSSLFMKRWTAKMGFPISSFSSIIIDKNGYVWATTFDGVVRFDGFKIKLFTSLYYSEITNDRFYDILEDRFGTIYFNSEIKRAYSVDSETGQLSVLTDFDGTPLYVNQMTKTSLGDILFSTKSGIYESTSEKKLKHVVVTELGDESFMAFRDQWSTIWYENAREELVRYANGKSNIIQLLKTNTLRYFDIDEINDKGWLSWNNSILEFNKSDYKIHQFDFSDKENTIIHLSYNSNSNELLLGTNNSGFYAWNTIDSHLKKSPIQGIALVAENGFSQNQSNNLLVTSKGIYDLKNSTMIYESTNDLIRGISQSADSSIWVATNGEGIIHLQKSLIKTIAPAANPNLYPIYEDKNGRIWVGSYGSGAYYLNDDKFEPLFLHNGIEDKYITSITETSKGDILFGANSSYLYSINPNGEKQKHLLPNKDNQIVSALFQDSKKNIWIGSTKDLFVKSPRQKNFSNASIISLTEKPTVRFIIESPDSSIWLSTSGAGLIRMNDFQADYVFKRLGLGDYVTRTIVLDPKYSSNPDSYILWVTTESHGIHRITVRNDSISIFSVKKENGLIDNTIHCIVFDDNLNFWMSANNGLSVVKRTDMDKFISGAIEYLPTHNYYDRDGLPSNEFNGGFQSTGFKGKSGLIYFANQKGLVSFNPRSLIQNKKTPKVFIEDVFVNNKPTLLNLNKENSLHLASGIYDVKLFISLISPSTSHVQKLFYKVNNHPTEWLEIEQGQPLNLSSLNWGTYSISLRSTLNPVEESLITNFSIIVNPLWYESPIFFISLGFLGVIFIYFTVKVRTQLVVKQNEKLENIIRKRSIELQTEQLKNLEASQKMVNELTNKNNIIKNIHSLIQQPSKLLYESLTVWADNHKEVLSDSSISSFNELIIQSKTVSEKLDRSIKLISSQDDDVEPAHEVINLNDLLHYIANSLKKKSISLQTRSSFSFEEVAIFSVFDGLMTQTALVDLIEFILRDENTSVYATVSNGEEVSVLSLNFNSVQESSIDSLQVLVSTIEQPFTKITSSDINYLSVFSSLKRLHENNIGIEVTKIDDERLQINFLFIIDSIGSVKSGNSDIKTSLINTIEEKTQNTFKIAIFDSSKNYKEIINNNLLTNCDLAIMSRNGIHGYATTIAESDMILLDSNFTYGDPFKLIETARSGPNGDKLTIVLMTTVFDTKEQNTALRIGADMYITKPLSNDALVAQIQSLLSLRKRLLQSMESHTKQLKLPDSGITRSDREFMEKVISSIRQNISNPDFNIELLAQSMKYNRTSLSKRIKKLVNRNPSFILQEFRIVKAVELLQTNEYNVSEVAFACGFSSLSYFSQAFKNHMNMSPSDWQAQQISASKT